MDRSNRKDLICTVLANDDDLPLLAGSIFETREDAIRRHVNAHLHAPALAADLNDQAGRESARSWRRPLYYPRQSYGRSCVRSYVEVMAPNLRK